MAGAGIQLRGETVAQAELGHLIERAEHPRPMWERIGASLVTSTLQRFDNGIDPAGSLWPPSLRALAQGGKTLIDTARLYQSITFNASDDGVEVGTNVIYAAIHQFGGDITIPAREQVLNFKQHKRTGKTLPGFRKAKDATVSRKVAVGAHVVNMPARPFLGLDDDDDAEMLRIVEDWLVAEELRL